MKAAYPIILISLILTLTACQSVLDAAYLQTLRPKNGHDGSTGAAGQQGRPGIQGQQGNQGQTGAQGAQGLAGADGTVITMVKLCPGTPSHTVFVEYAMCVNGQLYGVYSANSGFLALLSDGAYTSDGIGADCSLAISGCNVSH